MARALARARTGECEKRVWGARGSRSRAIPAHEDRAPLPIPRARERCRCTASLLGLSVVQLVLDVLGDVRDGALVLVLDRLPDPAVPLGFAHGLAGLRDQRLRLAAQRLPLGRLGVDLLLL